MGTEENRIAEKRIAAKRKLAKQKLQSTQQAEAEQMPAGNELTAILEPMAAIGVSGLAQPISGIAGLVSAPFVGTDRATDVVRDTESAISGFAQPRTQTGRARLRDFTESEPIQKLGQLTEAVESVVAIPGETLAEMGAPETGAIMTGTLTALPAALEMALGLRGGRAAVATGKNAAAGLDNAIQSVIGNPELKVIDEVTNEITPEAIDALSDRMKSGQNVNTEIANQLSNQGVLTPEQAQRFNVFARRDVQPTRAQVTQSTTDFQQQQELAKTSNQLSDVLASQDQALSDLGRKGIENIGPSTSTIQETNSSLFSVVDDVVGAAEGDVIEAYIKARESLPDEKIVKIDNFVERVRRSKSGDDFTGGTAKAIEGHLKNSGILSKEGWIVTEGQTGASGLPVVAPKRKTVAQSESVRQYMNQLYGDTNNPAAKRLIRELKTELDDAVESAVGGDLFSEARASNVKLKEIFQRQQRDKRDVKKGSLIEDILNNKIPEEKIVTKIKTARDDDFLKLKEFYLNDSGDAGIQSWNNLKGQILRDAVDAAVSTQGKREGGVSVFNVGKFKQQLKPLKGTKKYNELFTRAERDFIDDIEEIGTMRIPVTGTFTGRGASAQEIAKQGKATRNAILKSLPVVRGAGSLMDAVRGGKEGADARAASRSLKDVNRALDVTKETKQELRKRAR